MRLNRRAAGPAGGGDQTELASPLLEAAMPAAPWSAAAALRARFAEDFHRGRRPQRWVRDRGDPIGQIAELFFRPQLGQVRLALAPIEARALLARGVPWAAPAIATCIRRMPMARPPVSTPHRRAA